MLRLRLQDWFGTDLKIRRIGQYWTQLEYVVEVSCLPVL